MNDYYQLLTITMVTAALPCLVGAIRFRILDMPSRIFLSLLALGFITELTAYYYVMNVERNNMPVYNLSGLLQGMLMCLYFNYIIIRFRRHRIGWYIGAASLVLGVLNMMLLQPINDMNTNLFHYQVILLMVLGIIFIRQELTTDIYTSRLKWSVHFWFVFLLVNFALLNLISTGLYDFLTNQLKDTIVSVNLFLVCLTGFFNTGFALIFFLYPKLKSRYDRQ